MLKKEKKQVRGQLGHVVVRAVFLPSLDTRGFYESDIEIVLDGKKIAVVCKDVQFHPVSDQPIHVDFVRK